MNFTDSPFERMMKQKPRPKRPAPPKKPPPGSPCYGCSYWQGMACVGVCYRDLTLSRTSENKGTQQSQVTLLGEEEQQSGADFGPTWPEVAEGRLRRRGPKLEGGQSDG